MNLWWLAVAAMAAVVLGLVVWALIRPGWLREGPHHYPHRGICPDAATGDRRGHEAVVELYFLEMDPLGKSEFWIMGCQACDETWVEERSLS